MNPQQPGGPAWPPTPNQAPQSTLAHPEYEFIMNPTQPGRPKFSGSGSTVKRVAIAGGGLVILLIAFAIVSSLFKGSGFNVVPFTAVAQDQTELARVAVIGTTKVTSQAMSNFAYNTKYSMATSTYQLVTYLDTNKKKLDAKEILLKHSTLTDTELTSALANGNFDEEFASIMQKDLATYSNDLKAAYATNPGPKGQALLSAQYKGAQLLIIQSKQQ